MTLSQQPFLTRETETLRAALSWPGHEFAHSKTRAENRVIALPLMRTRGTVTRIRKKRIVSYLLLFIYSRSTKKANITAEMRDLQQGLIHASVNKRISFP